MRMSRSQALTGCVASHADRMTQFMRSEIEPAKSTFERAGLEPQ